MTILAAVTEAKGADFESRIFYLMEKAAVNIHAEDPNTALHIQRDALALAIVANPRQYVERFVLATITNLDLTAIASLAAVTDVNLQNAVNGIYNLFL